MKKNCLLLLFISIPIWVFSQVETNDNSLRIDRDADLKTSKLTEGLSSSELNYDAKLYKLPERLEDYSRNKKPFSMNEDNGLLKPVANNTPKWFKTEKDIKDEYRTDQFLGTYKSGGRFVMLLYRDHGSIDGDIVRIFINNDVIKGRAFLTGGYQSIKINNEGEASPNTAEFQVIDDHGNLITSNEWNLLTGVRASLTVIKE